MIFTALKHKTKPNTFAEPYTDMEDVESGFELRETSIPLLQPRGTTIEQMREAYEEGPFPAEKAIAQLEDYEMVELEVKVAS